MRVEYGECMPRWKLIKSWKRRQASIYLRVNPPILIRKGNQAILSLSRCSDYLSIIIESFQKINNIVAFSSVL